MANLHSNADSIDLLNCSNDINTGPAPSAQKTEINNRIVAELQTYNHRV